MNAREASLEALEKCRRDGAWSAAVIDAAIKKAALDQREAALASRIVLGVLQNQTLCDFYISRLCTVKKIEPKVRDILRMGIYQILFLDRIPARAAVNETVALCRSAGYARAAGLVNAVLRRVSDSRDNLPAIPNEGTAEHLSVKYSHPLWLAERLTDEKGYAFTEDFFAADNQPPKLDIQVNTLKISVEDYSRLLTENGAAHTVCAFPSGCIELEGGSVTALPGFEEGLFYVQDAAARTAAEISGVCSGDRVLDVCAAPGGKSFAAAIKMENTGSILSCDIHEKKLRLILEGAGRLGIEIIETLCNDARSLREEFVGAFDTVIADVPCSGIGVIRKKPEIRFKKEAELSALPQIQLDILKTASRYVKRNGTLLYSTCTVLRSENEAVVESFLEENRGFKLCPYEAGAVKAENGMHTFWPNTDGTDGFFAAKLIRTE